jgi:hypothetical protein
MKEIITTTANGCIDINARLSSWLLYERIAIMSQQHKYFCAIISLAALILLAGCPGKLRMGRTSTQRTALAAQSRTLPAGNQTSHTHTFTSPRGYTIDVPDNWTTAASSSPSRPIDFMAVCPYTDPTHTFTTNINVAVETLPSAMTTEAFYQQNLQYMSAQLPGFVLHTGSDFHGATGGKKMDYSWTMAHGSALRVCSYFFVQGNTGYCVTGSTTVGEFVSYESQFDASARSFRVSAKHQSSP